MKKNIGGLLLDCIESGYRSARSCGSSRKKPKRRSGARGKREERVGDNPCNPDGRQVILGSSLGLLRSPRTTGNGGRGRAQATI